MVSTCVGKKSEVQIPVPGIIFLLRWVIIIINWYQNVLFMLRDSACSTVVYWNDFNSLHR